MTILNTPVEFSIRSAMGGEVEQLNYVPPGINYDIVPGASVLYFFGPWGRIISQYIILESGIQIWDTQYEMECEVELSSGIDREFIELHNSVKNAFVNQWEEVPLTAVKGGQGGFSAGQYINNTVLFPGKNSYRTTDVHFDPKSIKPFADGYPAVYEVINQFDAYKFAQIGNMLHHDKSVKSLLHQLVHPNVPKPILPIYYNGKASEVMYTILQLLNPIKTPTGLTPTMKEKAVQLEAMIREKYNTDMHLTFLTRKLDSTVPHLRAAFKKHYGKTFHQYLIEYRIEKAKDFLLETNDDLDSIADLTHFVDGAHLGNVFKRIVGETPAQFREYRRGAGFSPE